MAAHYSNNTSNNHNSLFTTTSSGSSLHDLLLNVNSTPSPAAHCGFTAIRPSQAGTTTADGHYGAGAGVGGGAAVNVNIPGLLAMRSSAAGDDECESKSSSGAGAGAGDEPVVADSGDDEDGPNYSSGGGGGHDRPAKKKRYHRHSQHQIQEMERVFKECPHPDEKQRLELSRELKLDPRQVKFWFQNKRTQVKAQHERHDNAFLRTENEKLRAENLALRDAIANVTCPNCGGPASLSDPTFDDNQLRLENVRLREEIDRISKIAAKHVGRPLTLNLGITSSSPNNNNNHNVNSGSSSHQNNNMVKQHNNNNNDVNNNNHGGSSSNSGNAAVAGGWTMVGKQQVVLGGEGERAAAAAAARAAMEELAQLAHAGEPLWENTTTASISDDGTAGSAADVFPTLNYAVYRRRFPLASGAGAGAAAAAAGEGAANDPPPPPHNNNNNNNNNNNKSSSRTSTSNGGGGLRSESSRHSATVAMDATSLVQLLTNLTSWANTFCSIVSRALPVETLCSGTANTQDGAMQIIYAEFQLPSPLVSTRESYFLRYSKRMSYNNSVWAMVDVSLDNLNARSNPSSITPLIRCRRRPSGCMIEDLHNGYSKVTWVEHSEVDDRGVHRLYQPLVASGLAFGARRWVAILQRQCEAMQVANNFLAPLTTNAPSVDLVCPTLEGRQSLLKLAERMTNNFCGGVSASVTHTWITLSPSTTTNMNANTTNNAPSLSNNLSDPSTNIDDVRVLIRKSVDDPGRPPGVVLCAATSIWLPVAPSRVFDYLRDEHFRMEWDILSNMGPVEEIVHVSKGHEGRNNVSLLRVNGTCSNQPNMLILQECCAEDMSYMMVYAPVDIAAMGSVLNGGDPNCVALLPSGFSIMPDRPPIPSHVHAPNTSELVTDNLTPPTNSTPNIGSLLTVAFQILVDHVPTAKLSLGSVATVNNLISSTVLRIKNALSCDPFICAPPFP